MIAQDLLMSSAQRALLGRVHPEIRLVKLRAIGDVIVLSVIVECEPSNRAQEDVSEAATEIIADFPEAAKIVERFEVSNRPLPREDIHSNGWVFQRAE